MKVGDVVVPGQGQYDGCGIPLGNSTFTLHCGSGSYTHAIVASLDPFVLISDDGSMLWYTTVKPHYFKALCQASNEIQEIVAERLRLWRKEPQ